MKPTYNIEKITPEYAKSVLDNQNEGNRNIRENHVNKLRGIIRSGHWQPNNNDAICFSPTGRLLNGQHRLTAISLEGVDLCVLIGRGIPEEAFATMDTGSSRQASDYLKHKGISQPTMAAAIARVFLIRSDEHGFITYLQSGRRAEAGVDSISIYEFCLENESSLNVICNICWKFNGIIVQSRLGVALLHLIRNGANMDDVTEFASIMRPAYSGNLPNNHPARAVYQYFVRQRLAGKNTTVNDTVVIIVRAFNDFINDDVSKRYIKRNDIIPKVASR